MPQYISGELWSRPKVPPTESGEYSLHLSTARHAAEGTNFKNVRPTGNVELVPQERHHSGCCSPTTVRSSYLLRVPEDLEPEIPARLPGLTREGGWREHCIPFCKEECDDMNISTLPKVQRVPLKLRRSGS
jgi:hypothetical protein